MNDLTKEELEEIFLTISYSVRVIKPAIIKKIESMIENYCKHDSCEIYYDSHPMRCKQCGTIFCE